MKEKIKNIFNKISYIVEFCCALLFAVMVFNTVTAIKYTSDINVLYIAFAIVSAIMLIAIIVYNIMKDRGKIENIFVIFAIPLSLIFMIFMMPGQVPDEMAHMVRTYEVSEGKLFTPRDENGETSTVVPNALLNYDHSNLSTYEEFLEEAKKETNYSDTMRFISSAQGYSFILYIFPSIGFFIGRIFSIDIIYAIYLGRIINIVIYLLVGYYAIKKIPFGKLLLAIYMLMPMMLQQSASFSADVMVNSVSIYFIANLLNLLFKEDELEKKDYIVYCVLSAVLGMVKIVYAPLIGIGLLFIAKKNITTKKKALLIVLSIVIGIVFALASYLDTIRCSSVNDSLREYNELNNVNSSEQISKIIENPLLFLSAVGNDWKDNTFNYIKMAIGSDLSWFSISLNEFVIVAYLILILAAIVYENNKFQLNKIQKTWIIIISIGIILMVQLSMYLIFTPVGTPHGIGGIQGRYFIPVYILVLLCLCQKENYLKGKYANIVLPVISLILNASAIVTVCKYFI